MLVLRGLAYSDIHWDDYNNGLTMDDLAAVEDEVFEAAQEYSADIVLFGGDRFGPRNPPHHVRARADASLKRQSQERPVYALLGNHDREYKNAHSGHAFMHFGIFKEAVPNIVIMDERQRYTFQKDGYWIGIHAVPAGHSLATTPFKFEGNLSVNICLFHDMIRESWQQNHVQAKHGLEASIFDRPEFDLVLGGDNHVHQKLPLQNAKGYYIGSPCHLNWGDVGHKRGYIRFTIVKDGSTQWVDVEHVESKAPRFFKENWLVSEEMHVELNTYIYDLARKVKNNDIVHIILQGDQAQLSKVKREKLEQDIHKTLGVRKLRLDIEPIMVVKELVPELRVTKTPEEDWQVFVKSGKLDLEGLDPECVISMGLEVLNNVR